MLEQPASRGRTSRGGVKRPFHQTFLKDFLPLSWPFRCTQISHLFEMSPLVAAGLNLLLHVLDTIFSMPSQRPAQHQEQ